MDLDCTQQGILFSDERKNIQQPVFALGVLDTLPCFGIRHMPVVGVKLLSAGQKHSSPLPSPRWGLRPAQLLREGRGAPPSQRALPLPLRPPPGPPPPCRPRGARLGSLRGAGSRVGPADSEPGGILY